MAPQRYESKPVDPAPLGQPLHFAFSNRTAPNRFLKGAMTERLATWHPTDLSKRGYPTKELTNLYRRWGEGNIGTILTGNIMIAPDHLEAPGNMIIPVEAPFSGQRFEGFKEIAEVSKKHGCLILGQVSHPGRQVEKRVQGNPVSASAVPLKSQFISAEYADPHAATQEEIDHIIEQFAHAAEYLDKAGFDGIELHGAHGYLIAQFLSETSNQRTDSYGGSLTNRARLLTEITRAVQARVSPSFILGIKINSVEWQEKGFQPEEARELVKILEANRFDFVEISGGTYEAMAFEHKKESTKKRESFFIEFADTIVPNLKETKSFVTGGFRTVGAMVEALSTVDGVGLGRALCAEPELVKGILSGEVKGVIKGLCDDKEIGVAVTAAGAQIKQMGSSEEPFDASDEKAMEGFNKALGKFMEEMKQDVGLERYGFPAVEKLVAVPYTNGAAA